MNWKGILGRWQKPNQTVVKKNLDHKLMRQLRSHSLPGWSQIKYLQKFLSDSEKKAFFSALLVAIIASVGWLGYFLIRHTAIAPREGGEYIEGLVGQPKYLNPIFSTTNDVDADIVSLVYAGLLHYDQNGQLVPDLASSYTLSTDKKTYTVILNKNLHWPDGEPITADDITYTFETIQNPEVGSPLLAALQGVKVEKVDDLTINFVLKEPFAPFVGILTTGILPVHLWTDVPANGIRLAKLNLQPVGAGAWKFQKMIKDDTGNIQAITLDQNEEYHNTRPYFKNISFKFFNNFPEAINALRGQSISGLAFVPHKMKDKAEGKNIKIYPFSLPQYTALFFNPNQNPLLKDKDFRLALAKALDKNKIITETLGNEGEIIDSPILSGTLGYNPDLKKIAFDINDANTLLDKKWKRVQPEEYFSLQEETLLKDRQDEIDQLKKANTSTPEVVSSTLEKIKAEIRDNIRSNMTTGQSFYRKDNKNNVIHITLTTADTTEYTKAAQIIATAWQAVGVQTTIQTVSSYQLNKEVVKDRGYEVFLYGEIIGADPDPYPFWHSSQTAFPGLNLAMFSNRNADKILEEARTSFDNANRAKLYQKFQDILVDEVPAIFLYTPKYLMVANQDILGIEIKNPINPADRFHNINSWYIKTRWQWK